MDYVINKLCIHMHAIVYMRPVIIYLCIAAIYYISNGVVINHL
jgi:hypothetical protein